MDDELDPRAWADVVARRQEFRKPPQRIDELLSKLLARRGYGQLQAIDELNRVWHDVVNSKLAADSRPGNVRSGTLDVFAKNSAVVQELTFQTGAILRKLGEMAPNMGIKKLRIRIGEIG